MAVVNGSLSRRRDAIPLMTIGAAVLVGAAVAPTTDPHDVGLWLVSGIFALFGAGLATLGWSAYPRDRTTVLPTLPTPDGSVDVVPIRRAWAETFGVLGLGVSFLGLGAVSLALFVLNGPRWGVPGRGAVLLVGSLLLLAPVPGMLRGWRTAGRLGWVLEHRGIALPAAPGVRSIPWADVIGIDVVDVQTRINGRQLTFHWIVVRTADPSRYASARQLKPLRRLGPDATAAVSTHLLRCTPELALVQLRTLWRDEGARSGLGTSGDVRGQACAPFPGPA